MLTKKFISILFTTCLLATPLFSQEKNNDIQSLIANIIEDITAASEDEINLDAIIEDLVFFSENPINLNATSSEELGRLVFLSDFQIISILEYIKTNGPLLTLYELQTIVSIDYADINKLLPFVTLTRSEKSGPKRSLFKYGKHDLIIRTRSQIETPEGFKPVPSDNPTASRYYGNKLGLYTRYSFSTRGGLQIGYVGEKDPGEEFFKGTNRNGFDHNSMYIQLSNRGKIKNLVVGDFNADFGQGLTMWTGSSFGKSTDPMNVRKRSKGISKSSSTNENQYLRGTGITLKLGLIELSVFGSFKKIDANIIDTLSDGNYLYSSRPNSGLHRVASEIKNKKTLGEFITGGNANISWKNLKAGITGSFVNLNGIMEPPSQPYQLFTPPLNNRTNLGIDLTYGIGNHLFFGEAATTLGYGSGIITGGLFRLHQLLSVSITGRYYQKDYSTYYTGALADGSSPSNENGILTGFRFFPYRNWQMAGYVDVFQSPWLRFGINAPSRGSDYLLETTYSPKSRLNFSIRYRLKQKEKNQVVVGSPTRWVVPYSQQALRFNLAYSPTREIQLRSRIEFSWYQEENLPLESGIMVYQDISYRSIKIPLVLTTRLALFETDSWNTRIYAYENDVLYYFSIPAYYSRGSRVYLLAQYSITPKIDIWFRVAQIFFANQTSLGSGLDKIEGSTRSDARIQIRLKF
jgi:hypothetical protein